MIETLSKPRPRGGFHRRLAALVGPIALAGAGALSAHVYQFDNTTAAAIPTVAGAAGTTVYTSTGANVTITNNAYDGTQASMACKTIAVASEAGSNTILGPVSVTVPITHSRIGHLVVKLFTPTDSFTLMSRPDVAEAADNGADDPDEGDSSNLTGTSPITFSMAATDEAEDMDAGNTLGGTGTACLDDGVCAYNPNNGASALSENLADLDNDSKVGNWTLCVGDADTCTGGACSGGDTNGTLANWTLNLGAVSGPDTGCDDGTSSLNVTFTVGDSFTATSIGVGVNATHAERGDIRARLAAPDGTVYALLTQSTDTDDNYDVLLSGNSDAGEPGTAPVDDNDTDPTAAPLYNRLVTVSGLSAISEAANGVWTLRLCDRDNNAVTGTLNSAQLMLDNGTAAGSVCTSRVTYDWGANGNGAAFSSATVGGITIAQGTTTNYSSGLNSGTNWNFRTDTDAVGGHTGFYSLYMDAANTAGTQDSEIMGQEVTFTFNVGGTPYPVQDLEFSTLDSDQADGDFEDILHIAGAAPGGGYSRFSRTPASGSPVFEDAGDAIEGDGPCDNTLNCATEAYKFDQPVASATIGYYAGDDIPSEPGDQVVGITDFQFCAFDYGDAPDTGGGTTNYGTLLANNGARHVLSSRRIYLGANPPDGEQEGQQAAAATTDDTTQIGGVDDEDGVTLPFPSLTAGSSTYTVTVNATNTTGSTGYLVGYVDWNRDGDFNDAGEKSLTSTVNDGSSPMATDFNVTWNAVPSNAGGTSATYVRFRISTNQSAVESPVGLAPDGEVEDYPIPSSTLPVTVAWVETTRERGGIAVRLMTSSETQNAGFRIWGLDARGARTLLGRIPSKVVDSFAPQSYELRASGANVAAVEIEDIGTNGRNRLHGPFGLGTTVGERPEAARIDWDAVRAENARTESEARETAARSAVDLLADARISSGPGGSTSIALLKVREEGLHRLTYEQLLAAGIDLAATQTKASRVALYDNGTAIPRYVSSSSEIFGPGAYIDFLVRPQLTLASPYDALELRIDGRDRKNPESGSASGGSPEVTEALVSAYPDRAFSPSAPNGDPWYDARLLSFGSPAQATRSFDLPDLVDGPVELTVAAWGYTYFDGAAPDHHIVVKLNGTTVASESFDGLTAWDGTFDVADLVQETDNTLEIVVPGDTGFSVDLINLEGYAVAYHRATVALDGRFQGRSLSGGAPYAVDGFADGPVIAWVDSAGKPTRTELTAVAGRVTVADSSAEAFLAQPDRLLKPEVVAGVPTALKSKRANYLIITHPAFADSLGDLVALEQSRGLSTGVVTVDRIYAAYSDHAPSAEAIRRFVAASSAGGQLQYVLLVGADSSDPYDHLGLGSISFVPTAYLPVVADVSFSPTDEAIADTTGDGFPDVPIGRLPVRTAAELANVVAKLYSWDPEVAGAASALMSAGASDVPGELPSINGSFNDVLSGWERALAQVDDLGVPAVRNMVIAGFNAGRPLVSFVGHSSPGQWDFTPILRWQDVDSFHNAGRPNLVTQWGCWNSYYVEPGYESMSGRMLRAEGGAAGTIGASTLTSDASHRRLGVLFFQEMARQPTRLGDAFLAAKQVLRTEGGAQDAILGMALLGDPAMPLPFAEPPH